MNDAPPRYTRNISPSRQSKLAAIYSQTSCAERSTFVNGGEKRLVCLWWKQCVGQGRMWCDRAVPWWRGFHCVSHDDNDRCCIVHSLFPTPRFLPIIVLSICYIHNMHSQHLSRAVNVDDVLTQPPLWSLMALPLEPPCCCPVRLVLSPELLSSLT